MSESNFGCRYAPASRWAAFTRKVVLALVAGAGVALSTAAEPAANKATSGRAARDEAVKSVPLDRMPERGRAKVERVLQHPTLFRRLASETVDCDPDLHAFLIRHPDVLANIWEVLDISKVSMQPTGANSYRATDGAGTSGNIEYVYSDKDMQVIHCDGLYDGPLFAKKVRGECVLVLRSHYVRQANGRPAAVNNLDLFVRFDNIGIEFVAKTFSPLINKSADMNFTDTTSFIGTLSRTAERNPDGIHRLAGKLKQVDPPTRDEFANVAITVPERVEANAALATRPKALQRTALPASANAPLPR